MPIYRAPVRDLNFVLNDFLQVERYSNLPGFEEVSADLVSAILDECAKISEEVLQPLNQSGDLEGVDLKDGVVTLPKGFKEAYATFIEGGWTALTASPEFGGQGLPHVIDVACDEMASAANMGFSNTQTLTRGACAAIYAHGSDAQKEMYLHKMVAGIWSGTMNLTEPHCGTDLGLLRTKAEPHADGTHRISGTKIFISSGEQDLTENIIHLVLAKIPGGPDGSRGISLFIVPKFLVNDDGSLGERNAVECTSVEDKMGIHSNPTCTLQYEDAVGYLVGPEHNGLAAMFTMMNHARLGVGLQGLCQAEAAYQNAVAYTRERLQGRALGGAQEPDLAADPIIVHADVRRMLMNIRAFTEGARALALMTALRSDISAVSTDEEERTAADDWVQLLTPIVKAFLTDMGFQACVTAQQCFGGHGYIRDTGVEQFVRDARIAQIYEGTNGIQSLDLVGRKLGMNGARSVFSFYAEVTESIEKAKLNQDLIIFSQRLSEGLSELKEATDWLMENGLENPDNAGAVSLDYLHLFGLVAFGYVWTEMAILSSEKIASGDGDKNFYENKLITGRYFMEKMLPETKAHLARVKTGAEPVMALAADAF